MQPPPRILLVDDEETLRVSLSFSLSREGYEVLTAADGVAALRLLQEQSPDLVLLDLMLPGVDGMQICRWMRSVSTVPIVMLTARGDVEDKVLGLTSGVDDYVTKPFSPRELIARIQAVLRRNTVYAHSEDTPRPGGSSPAPSSSAPTATLTRPRTETPATRPIGRGARVPLVSSGVIEAGPVRIDLDRHETSVRGEPVSLAPREFQLLHALLSHRGRVLSRETLINTVWGMEFDGDPKTLDVHIRWLRAKIELIPAVPRHIVTVRGVGFRFD